MVPVHLVNNYYDIVVIIFNTECSAETAFVDDFTGCTILVGSLRIGQASGRRYNNYIIIQLLSLLNQKCTIKCT